jgi:hypothetical protein
VTLEISEIHGVPLTLVTAAVKAMKAGAADQRRGRGTSWDGIWCVFDQDDHPNIPQALDLARRTGINVAFSNPCIELWFLLHDRDQWSAIDRFEARRLSIERFGFDKRPSPSGLDALVEHHEDAVRRAAQLDAKHQGDGSPPHSNPSTTVGGLIESMRAAANGSDTR